jgi:hypothetical protein
VSDLKTKVAILQVADTGPLESLVEMLRAVGYECVLPDEWLRRALRELGGLVLAPEDLVRGMGYDPPMKLGRVGPEMMEVCDLYVDVKAHQTYGRLIEKWPNLAGKVLWYRINGGKPEHVVNARGDHGDEVNPPCPVLTPNQWYQCLTDGEFKGKTDGFNPVHVPWHGRAYCSWPPFVRFGDYYDCHHRPEAADKYTAPICLIHNLRGWGYGALAPEVRKLGVRLYGDGSPDGLIPHHAVPAMLGSALAYVHLKSSDAPGYALYEALAAGCPVICTRRLIWRCRMQALLEAGVTCLVYDRETHDGLSYQDVAQCKLEVGIHLARLRDPAENHRIGLAGRERLQKVMWSKDNPQDVASLRTFLERNFP